MNDRGALLTDMGRLIDLLAPHAEDRETIDWLRRATRERSLWSKAHGVFSHVRDKSLKAERTGAEVRMAQYRFEEICAKTLYNLSGMPAPFDADSAYWVVPNAFSWARLLGLSDAEVQACLSLQGPT